MHTPQRKTTLLASLKPLDYVGLLFQIFSSGCLLLALSFIDDYGQRQTAKMDVVVLSILFVIFLGVFIYIETHITSNPLIPRKFCTKTVAALCGCALFTGMTLASVAYFVPLYLQIVQEISLVSIALRLTVLLAGFILTSVASAAFVRYKNMYGIVLGTGGFLNVLGIALLIMWHPGVHNPTEYGSMLLIGLGKWKSKVMCN
jgi:hypothetical protein